MTNEKILEIKNELVNQGIIKLTIDDSRFLNLFEELKEWFKWDIQRFPYWDLDNKVKEFYNYEESDLKFYNKNYDIIVFSVILGIYICEKKEVLNNIEETNAKLFFTFTSFSPLKERSFYKNYQKICGINIDNLGFFIRGMIRNKMGNGTFEEFLNNYTAILQKYKPVPFIDKDGTIETTATPIVEPKYTPGSDGVMEQIKAKYGYVPAAYLALQHNPVGLWYMYQQTGQYRSKFVDYTNFPEHYCYYQDLINHINKVMSNRNVYEEILKLMPIIGTEFVNTKPVLLKFLGFGKTNSSYVLGVGYNNHTFAIKVDIKASKFETACGLNDDMNRIIDNYLNE